MAYGVWISRDRHGVPGWVLVVLWCLKYAMTLRLYTQSVSCYRSQIMPTLGKMPLKKNWARFSGPKPSRTFSATHNYFANEIDSILPRHSTSPRGPDFCLCRWIVQLRVLLYR